MSGFVRKSLCYEVSSNACYMVVPASEVAPQRRNPGLDEFSNDGFNEERMVSILHAFRSGTPLPPIEVTEVNNDPGGYFRYKVYHGVHRYCASIAAGFSDLPVTIVPDVPSFLDHEEAAGAETKRLR